MFARLDARGRIETVFIRPAPSASASASEQTPAAGLTNGGGSLLTRQMKYWKLKGCPRCNGDLFVFDEVEHCLQCGYTKELMTAWRPDIRDLRKGQPHHRKVGVR